MQRYSPQTLARLIASGAFALLLALGQQHAVLHWLSHALASVESHKSDGAEPADRACDECLGLTAFDASSPAPTWTPPTTEARDQTIAASAQPGVVTALRLAFRSRAPPIL